MYKHNSVTPFIPLFTVNQHAISSSHAELHVNKVIEIFKCLKKTTQVLIKIFRFSLYFQHIKYVTGREVEEVVK